MYAFPVFGLFLAFLLFRSFFQLWINNNASLFIMCMHSDEKKSYELVRWQKSNGEPIEKSLVRVLVQWNSVRFHRNIVNKWVKPINQNLKNNTE